MTSPQNVTDNSCAQMGATDNGNNVTVVGSSNIGLTDIGNTVMDIGFDEFIKADIGNGYAPHLQYPYLKVDYERWGGNHSGCYRITCAHCGLIFFAKLPSARYCSYRCINDSYIKRRSARKLEARKHVCPVCKTPFIGKRKDTIYCSGKCKQSAYRVRVNDGVPQ